MIIELNEYLKNKISIKKQNENRKIIYDDLLENIFKKPNFNIIISDFVKYTFNIFDKIYFNNNINKYITENKIQLTFYTSSKMIKTAGKVCIHKNKKIFKFVISSIIIDNIFKGNSHKKRINGITCNDKLECYISLFEHEFAHLVLAITRLNEHESAHGPLFKKLVKNMFGHTKYTHELLLEGDIDDIQKKTQCLKNDIKIGNYIITKKISGKTLKGKIIKINPKNVRIIMDDGKMYNIKYEIIEDIISDII